LAGLIVTIALSAAGMSAQQTAQPASTPAAKSPSTTTNAAAAEDYVGNYNLVSSLEFGVRGRSVSGSDNKYRSDLNYGPGVRLFDSSFFLRSKEGSGGPFDEFLVNSSGWGGDPHGYTRVSIEKSGAYRFDANVRRARYFNALRSLANPLSAPVGQHTSNTRHNFSDFDFTGLPENRRLKFYLGYSRDTREGPGTTTARFSGDESRSIRTRKHTPTISAPASTQGCWASTSLCFRARGISEITQARLLL
jgi:hypothetical protein